MAPANPARRKRALAASGGAAIVALIVWTLMGLRTIPDDGRAHVGWIPAVGGAPRWLAPGRRWLPAALSRTVALPAEATVRMAGEAAAPLVSPEGARFDLAGGELRVKLPQREGALDAFRALGPDWQRALSARVIEAARPVIARGGADPSPLGLAALGRAIQGDLGRALARDHVTLDGLRLGAAVDSPAARAARHDTGVRLLVIGLDSADWTILDPLIAAGRMPRLASLVRSGCRSRLRTISPVLSPVIWTSIATGKAPDKHGILDFVHGDASGRPQPVTSSERMVRASWNILSEAGIPSTHVGWWATWPAEAVEGVIVTDRLAYQLFKLDASERANPHGKVFPPEMWEELRGIVVNPEAIGDAEMSRYLVGGRTSPAALRHADLVAQLATAIAAEKTYLAATLLAMDTRPAVLTAPYFESPDVVSHLFMSFRPPRMPGVTNDELRAFGQAVDRFWAHQDEVVGTLVDRAGAGATVVVVSDHGFKTGENRPLASSRSEKTAARWHGTFGILVLAGPGIRAGASLAEASVLDVLPTLLTLLGLPVGQDMDGDVLTEALAPDFLARFPPHEIPTYEGAPLVRPAAPVGATDEGTLAKLVALGYVGAQRKAAATGAAEPAQDLVAAERSRRHFNLGLAAMDAGRLVDAERELREAARAETPPDGRAGALSALGRVLADLGRAGEAEVVLTEAGALAPHDPNPWYWRARLALDAGRLHEAGELVGRALAIEPRSARALVVRAQVATAEGRLEDAARDARRSTEIDPDLPEGWLEMGRLALRKGQAEASETNLRRALEADAEHPIALLLLAEILDATGRDVEAEKLARRATDSAPHLAAGCNALALRRRAAGRQDEALAVVRKGLEHAPDSPVLLNHLGDLLLRAGMRDEALSTLEKAHRLAPEDAQVLANLGAALGASGRPAEALPHLFKATELAPEHADAWQNLSRALTQSGRTTEGQRAMARAEALRSGSPPP